MRWAFGAFVADDGARQLLRDGEAVRLQPKAFDLLLTLLRARPNVLTKAELHEQLWPSVFVSDTSLAMAVAELRAALGETGQQSRFIRTVHRHGYAFQGEAREVSSSGAPPAAPPMDYWIVAEGRDFALAPGDNLVGRDPHARVWLDLPSVSRQHARIRVDDEGVTIEDLGSKNGTQLGDLRVTSEMPLRDGDRLRCGSVALVFRAWAAEPTRTEGDGC